MKVCLPYKNSLAFFLYCVMTYFLVYLPVSVDLRSTYLGNGETIFWTNYFWWFAHAIDSLLLPLKASYIFYPLGVNLTDGIVPFLLFAPVTKFFGAIVSYNLYLLLTFVLSGYGMYLLTSQYIPKFFPCFIAGMVFSLFPFRFGAALGHLHTFSTLWMPFYILFFWKMLEQPTYKNSSLAAFFFSLNALTSWTIAVMLSIASLIHIMFKRSEFFSFVRSRFCLIFAMLSGLLLSPGLYALLSEINEGQYKKPFGDFITYSSDLAAFITPSPLHAIWGRSFLPLYEQFSGNLSENIVFIGYSVLFLALVGCFAGRKRGLTVELVTSGLVFLILSLGPVLHIAGAYTFGKGEYSLPLPGYILAFLPVIDMIRVPSRYVLMASLYISMLAGAGVAWILARKCFSSSSSRYKSIGIMLFLTFFLALELVSVLRTQKAGPIPAFYSEIESNSEPILELPMCLLGGGDRKYPPNNAMLMNYYYQYQEKHERPFLGGYWSRVANKYEKFLYADPVLKYFSSYKRDIINHLYFNPQKYLKDAYGISHIVVHEKFITSAEQKELVSYLGQGGQQDGSVADDTLSIYKLDRTSPAATKVNFPHITKVRFEQGWYPTEYWLDSSARKEVPVRWIGEGADLVLHSAIPQSVLLKVLITSFNTPKELLIEVKTQDSVKEVFKAVIGIHPKEIKVPIIFQAGVNHISFVSKDGTERPSNVSPTWHKDSRDLSFAFRHLIIKDGR